MGARYVCKSEQRRRLVEAHATFNGIDFLEVLDEDASALGLERQRTLWVRCYKPLPQDIDADHVSISGGVRLKDVGVSLAFRMDQAPGDPRTTAAERAEYAKRQVLDELLGTHETEQTLVVRTTSSGDFSTYTLALLRGFLDTVPPDDFDGPLSRVDFTFKVECPSEFDCAPPKGSATPGRVDPPIDYLTRDYASFRRLLLDRLSEVAPQWKERNPADLGVTLVELMAYSADYLSYYQDAVATEAYLGTARKRTSVRRHARLLDYPMHDGGNARAWVTLQVSPGAEGWSLPGPTDVSPGAVFVTTVEGPRVLDAQHLQEAVNAGAEVFESLHPLTLHSGHGRILFHTWGEDRCCLPQGATAATLLNVPSEFDPAKRVLTPENFAPGRVLLLEEGRSPQTGRRVDADPSRRHAVRLTQVEFTRDPLLDVAVVEVAWGTDDALPFELCLWDVMVPPDSADEPEDPVGKLAPVSVARGNVVLVDHGRTLTEPLPVVPSEGRYRPRLSRGPLTQVSRGEGGRALDPTASAAAALRTPPEETLPALWLRETESGRAWIPRRTLLNSGRFSREFVAEVEDDGRARLRFGDNVLGERPGAGVPLTATYRIGNGSAGNVGAEAISHLHSTLGGDWRDAILSIRNPLPARGGVDPESVERVRIDAPESFRVQQRAVTEADYAEVAQRHPEVQRAVGSLRWTGSWHTMFVTVDRRGGFPVDADFAERLTAFLERFRLAGYDLRVDAPLFVPLDIAMTVCVSPGYLAANVKAALLEVFSTREQPGGLRGFFHPDNFTFGQPVYLSQLVATAMKVPGVAWVETEDAPGKPQRFRRWGQVPRDEWKNGLIEMERLEIARLDNDPSQPENGKLDFFMQGGL
ncbi:MULTISPECIES: putative baseplate assembly protein [Corallococcus]|uniref:putative baseplate assembly protein n=1 Tax=Corallococcus TaxID=83461 RepID=UPI00117D155B|nr:MULTISPECIES: putative baseplate assembly protein [Corallococcus]NBD09002.1 putative baseplate assembly protein [Corallococcus silvisoli]TSC32939.1 putative baseplate assembly protein [Corallococcus sp. Z5C101001]